MDWSKCSETINGNQVATIKCIPDLFVNLINWALIFSGVIALFFVIWGGFTLVTSGGDKTKVDQAKKTITFALLGLIVILISFFIVRFIAYVTGVECITSFGFDQCAR